MTHPDVKDIEKHSAVKSIGFSQNYMPHCFVKTEIEMNCVHKHCSQSALDHVFTQEISCDPWVWENLYLP